MRQGLTPAGARRVTRLDAKRESPVRSGSEGDAPSPGLSSGSTLSGPCHQTRRAVAGSAAVERKPQFTRYAIKVVDPGAVAERPESRQRIGEPGDDRLVCECRERHKSATIACVRPAG